MNPAHFHLIVNHLPIISPIIAFGVLVVGLLLQNEVIKRVAYGICIFAALSAVPASVSGENAEDVVENLQGIDHNLIHTHEEAAEKFAVVVYLLGIAAAAGLFASWKQKGFANILQFVILALCAISLFLARQAGTTGGEIRHTEIRQGNTHSTPTPDTSEGEKEHD
jgi:uncharacterized transporter YbjL